ncbi:MAG: phosphorylase [Rhizonema sp. NSF051]|nr:phosphorylase [Rhizonema sp. NSF051]
MSDLQPFPTILVCQGAEYQAVCRGLSRASGTPPSAIAIPVGRNSLTYLYEKFESKKELPSSVLLMGLCGSLTPRYTVGDILLYQNCIYQGSLLSCDLTLTAQLASHLQTEASLVTALTSDRVICHATEKRHLAQISGADVVDMEGFGILEFFRQFGVAVAMLRVVSDNCYHDVPDLTPALNDGSLQPLPLAIAMLRQPIAATRLIRGAMLGLKILEQVTTSLL